MAGTHTIVWLAASGNAAPFVLKLSSPREAFVYRHRAELKLTRILPFGRSLTREEAIRLIEANGQVSIEALLDQKNLKEDWAIRRNKNIEEDAIRKNIVGLQDINGKNINIDNVKKEILDGKNYPILMENLFFGSPSGKGDRYSIDIKIGYSTKSEIQYRYENPEKFRLMILFKIFEHWIKDNIEKNSRNFGFDAGVLDIYDLLDFVNRKDVAGDSHRHIIVQHIALAIADIERIMAAAPLTLIGASINIILAQPKTGDPYFGPVVCLIDPDHPILRLDPEPPATEAGGRVSQSTDLAYRAELAALNDLHEEARIAGVITDRNWVNDTRLTAIVGARSFADWFRTKKERGFMSGIRRLGGTFRQISVRKQRELEQALSASSDARNMIVTVFELSPEDEREFLREEANRRAVAKRQNSDAGGAGKTKPGANGRPPANVESNKAVARPSVAPAKDLATLLREERARDPERTMTKAEAKAIQARLAAADTRDRGDTIPSIQHRSRLRDQRARDAEKPKVETGAPANVEPEKAVVRPPAAPAKDLATLLREERARDPERTMTKAEAKAIQARLAAAEKSPPAVQPDQAPAEDEQSGRPAAKTLTIAQSRAQRAGRKAIEAHAETAPHRPEPNSDAESRDDDPPPGRARR
jgi:hypothetical protein